MYIASVLIIRYIHMNQQEGQKPQQQLIDLIHPSMIVQDFKSVLGRFITPEAKQILGTQAQNKLLQITLMSVTFSPDPNATLDNEDIAAIGADDLGHRLTDNEVGVIVELSVRMGYYQRDPTNPNSLKIVPKTQEIVREIFEGNEGKWGKISYEE
jgi:hypothetical protein